MDLENTQRQTLKFLLSQGARTSYGRELGFSPALTYEEWCRRTPMVEYEDIRSHVMRMLEGEASVLWPGKVKRFAQSSGTSGGKSKYIPVTPRGLSHNHYRGAAQIVARYLHFNPRSRLMDGKSLILGGSFANEVHDLPRGVKVGDLSAHLIDAINPAAELLRVPSHNTALMADWHSKLPQLVKEVARQRVTNLSGVPSWMMTVLREVLAYTGASTIKEVWPGLEVFFHGGISFDPYRTEYQHIMGMPIKYMETYNASEGFFALQYLPQHHDMMLITDNDNFYELLAPGAREPIPAWEANPGDTYELLVTNSNGLWRYRPGDTVKVHSTSPLTITIAGRTQQYINAFGEELMVHNAEAAMHAACRLTGATVANYTAAPLYATEGHKGCHQWLVEWTTPPADVARFAAVLDGELRRVNSDYDAKRSGDIFLDPLSIVTVSRGTFDRWLQSTGKLGGQRKVPRLCPDRRFIDNILKLTDSK